MLSGPVRAGYWGLVSGKEEIEHFGGEIRAPDLNLACP
jgi:hypothetical protein